MFERDIGGSGGTEWVSVVLANNPDQVFPIEWDSNWTKIRFFVKSKLGERAVSREWKLDYVRIRHYPLKRSEVLRIPTYAFVLENGQVELVRTFCPATYAAVQ